MKLSPALYSLMIMLFWVQPDTVSAEELSYLIIANQAEPFQINTSNHQASSGIISDVISLLATKKPFKIVPHVMPFKRYNHEIKAKTYTKWISYGSPAWRDNKQVLTQNKRLSKQALFSVNHTLVQLNSDRNTYSNAEDLFGKTVILLKGFSYPGLTTFIENDQIKKVEARSHQSALQALINKRGEVFIEMENRIRYAIKQHSIDQSRLKLTNATNITPSLDIHLSYGDNVSQDTINWIDDQIVIMKANAQLESIINRYQ
ncbi:transporter substrate-binding domain-containing protein [Shewanella marinintestina]|uniref:transporter substrate-binding domain-containing protein n=1 Tax=Shewanella marinintestina TaxID=190305 RepID=UPI0020105398|nr:transporter substrate-binding domain-containing protein [Shewanella marinintestina]MCL1144753.1 transporter substrate-binding domain-containing protein [Shewanella marinintestina]